MRYFGYNLLYRVDPYRVILVESIIKIRTVMGELQHISAQSMGYLTISITWYFCLYGLHYSHQQPSAIHTSREQWMPIKKQT